jgi:hypothetical protein
MVPDASGKRPQRMTARTNPGSTFPRSLLQEQLPAPSTDGKGACGNTGHRDSRSGPSDRPANRREVCRARCDGCSGEGMVFYAGLRFLLSGKRLAGEHRLRTCGRGLWTKACRWAIQRLLHAGCRCAPPQEKCLSNYSRLLAEKQEGVGSLIRKRSPTPCTLRLHSGDGGGVHDWV